MSFLGDYITGMIPRICICCGELMAFGGNALSRNPNLCASCSSILDGMDEPELVAAEKPDEESHALLVVQSEESAKA